MAKSPTDYLRLERIRGGEFKMRLRCRECGGGGHGPIEDEYGNEPPCKGCAGSGTQVEYVSYEDFRRALRRSNWLVWDSRLAFAVLMVFLLCSVGSVAVLVVLAIIE